MEVEVLRRDPFPGVAEVQNFEVVEAEHQMGAYQEGEAQAEEGDREEAPFWVGEAGPSDVKDKANDRMEGVEANQVAEALLPKVACSEAHPKEAGAGFQKDHADAKVEVACRIWVGTDLVEPLSAEVEEAVQAKEDGT